MSAVHLNGGGTHLLCRLQSQKAQRVYTTENFLSSVCKRGLRGYDPFLMSPEQMVHSAGSTVSSQGGDQGEGYGLKLPETMGSHDTLLDIRKGQPILKQETEAFGDRVHNPHALFTVLTVTDLVQYHP